MNSYTSSAKILRAVDKQLAMYKKNCQELGTEPEPDLYDKILERDLKFDERVMRLSVKRMIRFKEICIEEGLIAPHTKGYYMITVRPDEKRIDFDAFYMIVQKYVSRKCFKTFTLTFEQKGTSNESLGKGFHIHIVAAVTQRSKGEVLRDAQSTFKDCTAPNCIKVKLIDTTPEDAVQHYFVDYNSADGHKETTKTWDTQWREREGLDALYVDKVPTARIVPIASSSTGRLLAFD